MSTCPRRVRDTTTLFSFIRHTTLIRPNLNLTVNVVDYFHYTESITHSGKLTVCNVIVLG